MRDPLTNALTEALRSTDADHARVEASRLQTVHRLAQEGIRTNPPQPKANRAEQQRNARHEGGHIIGVYKCGGIIEEARVFDTATGFVRYRGAESLPHLITITLAGMAAEARYYAPSIHKIADASYDVFKARELIDEANALGKWPPITFASAARSAVEFVNQNWQAIENVAMALDDVGAIDDFAARLFARCAYE